MSFTYNPVPLLTPEQQNPMGNMIQNAMKQYQLGIQTQYARPNALADLLKKQQYNEMYKPDIQSQIGLRGAQAGEAGARTGLLGEQTKYYAPNIQSEMELRKAQTGLYGSQSQEAMARARKLQMLTDYLSGGNEQITGQPHPMEQQPNYQMNGTGMLSGVGQQQPQIVQQQPIQQAPQESAYGIPTPQPTRQDMLNKLVLGIDTYGKKQEQAIAQQNEQRKAYTERSIQTNHESQAATAFDQDLDRYNYWMDHANEKGPIKGKLPALGGPSQTIENIIADMGKGAIEATRAAMNSARFSNLDMQVAQSLKPSRSWDDATRQYYTDYHKDVNRRLKEKNKFYSIAGRPENGIPVQTADALWTAYQNHHPIVKSAKSKELNEYKADQWEKYLSPEALKSIKEKGDYEPKDKGLIKKERLTSSEQRIIKDHSLEELEAALRSKK